ncbi:S-layer homology domain-containing protein [Paenibacillus spongiae]|uniref:Ig-like domain-containing protein n=1 Tax=Paenibacillus spongiae TaxID=2909671 RepID=A0ABY5SAK2_9BACL|nr:Ig-like domain-containing protein [Paenibacillus spongiae]UVI30976.1 Ig-like domain-containing protein [Paenibacillus spongiae]
MKRNLNLFMVVLIALSISFTPYGAQLSAAPAVPEQVLELEKVLGSSGSDIGYGVIPLVDGYVIAGQKIVSHPVSSHTDAVWLKTDLIGNLVGEPKQFGGTDGNDMFHSIIATSDGGYLMTGYSYSASTYFDTFVVKTNASGDMLWEKHLGGSGEQAGRGIVETTDGYLVLSRTNTGANNYDIQVFKLAADGEILWEKQYLSADDSYDVFDIALTADNGFVVAGSKKAMSAPSTSDAFLMKYNAAGEFVWEQTYDEGGQTELFNSVTAVSAGGFILAGETKPNGSFNGDAYLIKTDSLGEAAWKKAVGGSSGDVGVSVIEAADGGYMVAGRTYSYTNGPNDIYMFKTNASGDVLWETNFGGASFDTAYDIKALPNNEYVMVGSTNSSQMYLVKTKVNPNLAPPPPVITGITEDSGRSESDYITSDTTLYVHGTAEASATVTVYLDNVIAGTTAADASGAWSYDYTASPLASGSCTFSATATNALNITGARSLSQVVEIDPVAPSAPVITKVLDDPDNDRITTDNTLILQGTAEGESMVTIYLDGGSSSIGTTTAAADGAWSFDYTGTTLADGIRTFKATATDIAGNVSLASSDFAVRIKTSVPSVPVITSFSVMDDGVVIPVAIDGATNKRPITIHGTGDAGSTITVYKRNELGMSVTAGTTVVTAAGQWSFDQSSLMQGENKYSAMATDLAFGLSSARSSESTIIYDTTKPLAPTITVTPTEVTYQNVTATITYANDVVVRQYKLGSNGVYTNYSGPIAIHANTTLYARGQDQAGNWSEEELQAISNIRAVPSPGPVLPVPPQGQTRQGEVLIGDEELTNPSVTFDIVRMTTNGVIADNVKINLSKTREIIARAGRSSNQAVRIIIADPLLPGSQADEVRVNLPGTSLRELSQAGLVLEIKVGDTFVTLTKESLKALHAEGKDIDFRFIPVRNPGEQQVITDRVVNADEVKEIAGGQEVDVIGSSMRIETNDKDHAIKVMLPINSLPGHAAQRQAFLDSLAVYIEQSDGEKKLQRGVIKYDKQGSPLGIEIEVTAFGIFTVISLEEYTGKAYVFGYRDGSFKPDQLVTRAEFAAMLARLLPASSEELAEGQQYADVLDSYWAEDAIAKVSQAGLMNGFPDGSFGPGAVITRAEIAVIAQKLKVLPLNSSVSSFTDIKGHWAEQVIAAVQQANILRGHPNGKFLPDQGVTRAESIVFLNRLFERKLQESGLVQSSWTDVPLSHWAFKDIESASNP